jgi:hypothetical protein
MGAHFKVSVTASVQATVIFEVVNRRTVVRQIDPHFIVRATTVAAR